MQSLSITNPVLQLAVIAVAGLGAAAVLLLLVVPEVSNYRIIFRALVDASHAPLFAALAWPACWLIRPGTVKRYVMIWLALGLAGIALEVAQSFTGRDPSWFDVFTNQLGAALGLAVWALLFDPRSREAKWVTGVLSAIIVLCLALVLLPVTQSVTTWSQRHEQFPVLFNASFADARDMLRSVTTPSDIAMTLSDDALMVDLLGGPISGVEVKDIEPDWRGYEHVYIDLQNDSAATLQLAVLIGDFEGTPAFEDRFVAELALAPSERKNVRFDLAEVEAAPATRAMPMDKISEIVLHRTGGSASQFTVRAIWLR